MYRVLTITTDERGLIEAHCLRYAVADTLSSLKIKRGWKVLQQRKIVERVGVAHEAVRVEVSNSKGVMQHHVLVYDVDAAPMYDVHSPWNGEQIKCDCGVEKFYSLGRSLDYNNWQCVECGAAKTTMTETGMSR